MVTLTTTGQPPITSILVDLTTTRVPQTILHDVIGRDDPIPHLGVLGTRTGTMGFRCSSYDAAEAIAHLFGGRVVHVTTTEYPAFSGAKTIATRVSITPFERFATAWAWDVTVDFDEVL